MATPICMPDLGTTVEEFTIIAWRVREGETVALGDPLADIETDKAVTELESTAAGTVLQILIDEGDVAHTGDVLLYVGSAGESIPAKRAVSRVETRAQASSLPPSTAGNRPVQVAPVVRNLAARLGVDLTRVQGSGPNGLITREDVQRAAAAPASCEEGHTLPRHQAAVARAVTQSWTSIPHTYFTTSFDMTAAQTLRAQSQASGMAISYDAMLLSAMAQAITAMPRFAWRLEGEQVHPADGIHLALAIDADDELLLPVIRAVDTLTLPALQAEIDTLAAQARTRSVPQSRLSGGCMACSNLGMYPLESFCPIIFPGHSVMLAIGRTQRTPVVLDGQLAIRPLLQATLAVDHRLINGRAAAAFLTQIKTAIESSLLEGRQ